jgi:hypothetical protein
VCPPIHRAAPGDGSTARDRAIDAQQVPASEMNWLFPYGNPASKYVL